MFLEAGYETAQSVSNCLESWHVLVVEKAIAELPYFGLGSPQRSKSFTSKDTS